jgi:hypothetical protein
MPRGGARVGAGRPAGIPNKVRQQSKYMRRAASQKARGGKQGIDYLQKNLSRFDALAEEAWLDSDPILFTRYAKIVIEISSLLTQFQTPRLNAIAVAPAPIDGHAEFHLNIFERERRPFAIESRRADEQTNNVIDAVVTEPNKQSTSEEPPPPPRQASSALNASAPTPSPPPSQSPKPHNAYPAPPNQPSL